MKKILRGVAQFGRALRSGRRGRVFESRHSDGIGTFDFYRGFRYFFVLRKKGNIGKSAELLRVFLLRF